MLRIAADLFEERGRGGDDLVQQIFVGTIELEQRRQFVADFRADHRHGFWLGQRFMNTAQDVIEQPLMPAFPHESAQRAGGERGEIDRLQLGGNPAGDERHQARRFRRRNSLGQKTQREAGEIGAALAVAQPVGNEGAEVDLAQLGIDRRRFEKMHLDEFAELVGDAVLIALDDRGVRDRQSQRPAKQRHYRVPVGQSADRRGFRKRRDEAEDRMHWEQRLRRHKQRQRACQHQRGQRLDAPQLGRARGVAGRVE